MSIKVKLLLERTSGVPLVIFCCCLYSALTCLLKENSVSGFACFPSYLCCVRYHPCCHGSFTARGDSRGVIAPASGEQGTEVFWIVWNFPAGKPCSFIAFGYCGFVLAQCKSLGQGFCWPYAGLPCHLINNRFRRPNNCEGTPEVCSCPDPSLSSWSAGEAGHKMAPTPQEDHLLGAATIQEVKEQECQMHASWEGIDLQQILEGGVICQCL